MTVWHSFGFLVWQQRGGEGGWLLWLPLVFIFGIFYFLLILPQQKRQKKWQKMLNELKNGDKVVTSGGIRGTVIALREDHIHLRVPPDNLRLEVAKSAVVTVTPAEEKEKS
ncbi:MAG: preprotein translocase subunit YajC [Terriglobales bacterium]